MLTNTDCKNQAAISTQVMSRSENDSSMKRPFLQASNGVSELAGGLPYRLHLNRQFHLSLCLGSSSDV